MKTELKETSEKKGKGDSREKMKLDRSTEEQGEVMMEDWLEWVEEVMRFYVKGG